MRRPLSEIIKEMSCSVLTQPGAVPVSEAAHAALLLAHVAWNRAEALVLAGADYRSMLGEFERSNRHLWDELKSSDAESLIAELVEYKQVYYPNDHRQIVVCGMRGDNVRVEWIDPPAS